jgi:hypothetical protein
MLGVNPVIVVFFIDRIRTYPPMKESAIPRSGIPRAFLSVGDANEPVAFA